MIFKYEMFPSGQLPTPSRVLVAGSYYDDFYWGGRDFKVIYREDLPTGMSTYDIEKAVKRATSWVKILGEA